MLKKIKATGNPGCTLFNSECTISAENTLRIGAGISLSNPVRLSHSKNSGGGLHGFCSRAGAENLIVTPLESLIELAAGNISPATENFFE